MGAGRVLCDDVLRRRMRTLVLSVSSTVGRSVGRSVDPGTTSRHFGAETKTCTNLEILDLSCNIIGDKGAVSLAESVKCCLKLVRLNLSLNRIGDVGAMAVANATKCLVYLCSDYITNTNDILQHVSGHNVDFHTLTFSGCGIGDSDVESLLHLIDELGVIDSKAMCELSMKTVQCYSSVHVLDISSNDISCHGAVALSSCLKYFPYLEELDISSNNIEAQGAIAIASSLSGHLHKLNISNNRIPSSGANSIADALKQCTHLEELNIRDNQIGDVGLCVLASTFCHYAQCLHKLDISNNNIGINGVNAIANALKQCTHLEELNISNNRIEKDRACSLASTFCHYAQCLHCRAGSEASNPATHSHFCCMSVRASVRASVTHALFMIFTS